MKNKLMEKIFIGIDVSKETLDICVKKDNEFSFEKIKNSVKSINKFLKQFKSVQDRTIVCMENTGRYNIYLYDVLENFSFSVYVINPLHIKKSLGLIRGKDDKTDAKRIVVFTEKNEQELCLWQPDSAALKKLKALQTERNSRVKMRSALLTQQSDYGMMQSAGLDKKLMELNKKLIVELNTQIKSLEAEIEKIIDQDEELREQAERMRSIPGVGKVLCCMMITKTQGFKKIDDPRKMACYAGVVPFEYQSGTSLRYKPRVSVFADKELKKILHLAAMSAIRLNNDLRRYYLRKVEEGKNKMAVLNAVRNKIIHRIFALIRNQTFYQNSLVLS